ncbi:MAG: hypothetical protein ACD_33C00004G0003 [uncultured bacterium]|nr:MAG: hypothetical protein ACD_33C00004G0003 [uncultured bacterium]
MINVTNINETKFQQKKITREINKVIDNGFNVMPNDNDIINESKFNWDDLTALKDELASKIFEFINQVTSIVTNPNIINNLNDNKEQFNQTVKIFFSDINDFSNSIKVLREQHEHLTGLVKDVQEYDLYNRLAIHYHSSFIELISLITPTLSNLVLITSEVANKAKQNNTPVIIDNDTNTTIQ